VPAFIQPEAFSSSMMKPMPSRRSARGKMRMSRAQLTWRTSGASLGVSKWMKSSRSTWTAMPLVAGHAFGLWA
jgi:hypothetical protein